MWARGSFVENHKLLQSHKINLKPLAMSFNSLSRLRLAYGCDACLQTRSEIYKLSAGYNRFRRWIRAK